MKWELDDANHEEWVFNDHIGIYLASFKLDIFAKAYALGLSKQLLNHKFLDKAIFHFNYEDVGNSWMVKPTVFISQPGNIYPLHGSGNHFHYSQTCSVGYMVRQITHFSKQNGFRQLTTFFLHVSLLIGHRFYLWIWWKRLRNTRRPRPLGSQHFTCQVM